MTWQKHKQEIQIMKDKNTIINELVANAADTMAAKGDELLMMAQIYADQGRQEMSDAVRESAAPIFAAVELIRERSGSWA